MKDFFVIIANPNPKDSISCKVGLTALKKLEKNQKVDIKIINLYDYKIPFYSAKTHRDFGKKAKLKLLQSLKKIANEMRQYKNYVFIYPVWWSNMPAILKNFFDWSVFFGVSYDFKSSPKPLHKNKKALVICACGASDYSAKEKKEMRNIIDYNILYWWGIKNIEYVLVEGTNSIKENKIKEYIDFTHKKLLKLI